VFLSAHVSALLFASNISLEQRPVTHICRSAEYVYLHDSSTANQVKATKLSMEWDIGCGFECELALILKTG